MQDFTLSPDSTAVPGTKSDAKPHAQMYAEDLLQWSKGRIHTPTRWLSKVEALMVSQALSAKIETFQGSFIPPKERRPNQADKWPLEGDSTKEGALTTSKPFMSSFAVRNLQNLCVLRKYSDHSLFIFNLYTMMGALHGEEATLRTGMLSS